MARIKHYDNSTNSWTYADTAGSSAEFVSYDKERVYSDGTVGKALQDGSVPEVTSADNGKALVVEDGEWAVDIISGLPDPAGLEDGTIIAIEDEEWVTSNLLNNLYSLLSSILPLEYNTSTNYKSGDVCMHNNAMYQCTAATTGTWNSAYWTQIRINNTATLHYEEV